MIVFRPQRFDDRLPSLIGASLTAFSLSQPSQSRLQNGPL